MLSDEEALVRKSRFAWARGFGLFLAPFKRSGVVGRQQGYGKTNLCMLLEFFDDGAALTRLFGQYNGLELLIVLRNPATISRVPSSLPWMTNILFRICLG